MEKSPVWKYFQPTDGRMSCKICGAKLTARDNNFKSFNLEKHLRLKHAESETFLNYLWDKEEWRDRNPRKNIAAESPLDSPLSFERHVS